MRFRAGHKPGRLDGRSRRNELRRLDDLLDELEELNEQEATALPEALAERLADAGIRSPGRFSISRLHDLVLDLQRPLVRSSPGQARVARRREPALLRAGAVVGGFRIV